MDIIALILGLTTQPPVYAQPFPVVAVVQKVEKPKPPEPKFSDPIHENLYEWGNCTKYVADKLSIPNSWGNAATWLPTAEYEGYVTGSKPKVGSVAWFEPGWSLGHVAYVEEVYPDGSFLISEMNVEGLNVISSRVITREGVRFIYGKI